MVDLWEREVEQPLLRGPLNMVHITLACALGMEVRNPSFQWHRDHPKLRAWLEPLAARPAFAATAPPAP